MTFNVESNCTILFDSRSCLIQNMVWIWIGKYLEIKVSSYHYVQSNWRDKEHYDHLPFQLDSVLRGGHIRIVTGPLCPFIIGTLFQFKPVFHHDSWLLKNSNISRKPKLTKLTAHWENTSTLSSMDWSYICGTCLFVGKYCVQQIYLLNKRHDRSSLSPSKIHH